jgi:hypothetical protein
MYTFFEFTTFYQNIDAQICMHVKNHYHHINYLELNYAIFSHLNLLSIDFIYGR